MRTRNAPKRFSLYRVTESDVKSMEVGDLLIDKGNRLITTWEFINFKTGDHTSAVGKRVGLVCPECAVQHRKGAPLGHDGDHGPTAPILHPDDEETPA